MKKKVAIVGVLCFAVFCGFVAPLAGQLNLTAQSKLYKTTTVHLAWQVRAHNQFSRETCLLIFVELCCFCWACHRWILLCSSRLQTRSQLCYILDLDSLSSDPGLGRFNGP